MKLKTTKTFVLLALFALIFLNNCKDDESPNIELYGENTVNVLINKGYVEPGFKATDNEDGDITNMVTYTSVNTNELGEQVIIYSVSDEAGNSTSVERTVNIYDDVAPYIGLYGDKTIIVVLNTEYIEPGFYATDNEGGDITKNVFTYYPVNTDSVASYTIRYFVSDDSGNSTFAERTVKVYNTANYFTDTYNVEIVYPYPGTAPVTYIDSVKASSTTNDVIIFNNFGGYEGCVINGLIVRGTTDGTIIEMSPQTNVVGENSQSVTIDFTNTTVYGSIILVSYDHTVNGLTTQGVIRYTKQ